MISSPNHDLQSIAEIGININKGQRKHSKQGLSLQIMSEALPEVLFVLFDPHLTSNLD